MTGPILTTDGIYNFDYRFLVVEDGGYLGHRDPGTSQGR
jgi:hypothetical protein